MLLNTMIIPHDIKGCCWTYWSLSQKKLEDWSSMSLWRLPKGLWICPLVCIVWVAEHTEQAYHEDDIWCSECPVSTLSQEGSHLTSSPPFHVALRLKCDSPHFFSYLRRLFFPPHSHPILANKLQVPMGILMRSHNWGPRRDFFL